MTQKTSHSGGTMMTKLQRGTWGTLSFMLSSAGIGILVAYVIPYDLDLFIALGAFIGGIGSWVVYCITASFGKDDPFAWMGDDDV